MSEQDLKRLREKLLEQRKEIFERRKRLVNDWKSLGERDIELEEEAQKTDLTSLYDLLNEIEVTKIEAIDLALQKIAAGRYGVCENCPKPISLERLEAKPEARLCRKCARKFEEQQKKLPPPLETISPTELPEEFKEMDDEELREAIYESLRNDGRVDLEELDIVIRNSIIYLEGCVPGENAHQIIIRILTDMMGFSNIIDHLETNKLIWQRRSRAGGRQDFPTSYSADEISEDVFESQEKETPYMFPDRPPSEKE